MASWQPPIPSGALYSRPARDLGPALALLAWCYDAVQRDGCFELQLKEVAHEMDEPYHTVVKWWAKLQAGPFFVGITDKGRSGFRVQFHDDWIEWRILSSRGTKTVNKFESPDQVIETQQPDPVTEPIEQVSNTAQKLFNDSSITAELPIPVIENKRNKEDKRQETRVRSVAASADAPTAQPEKKKRPAKTEPQSPIEVRRAIAKGSQIDLDSGLQKDIIQVNQVAATIWNKLRTPDQALDSVLSDIRACGKWVRNSQHPYKGSDQCMPPSALVRFWPAWKESAKPKTPYLNGHTNGTQAPHDYSQDVSPYSDEYRAQLRAGRVR